MDNTTSYYADCTIFTQPNRASAIGETMLCLDFKHVPHSKALRLSLMWTTKYEPTDSWKLIVERLLVELPRIYGVDCTSAQQNAKDRYIVEFGMKQCDVAAAIDALREHFKVFDFTISIFAGSLR